VTSIGSGSIGRGSESCEVIGVARHWKDTHCGLSNKSFVIYAPLFGHAGRAGAAMIIMLKRDAVRRGKRCNLQGSGGCGAREQYLYYYQKSKHDRSRAIFTATRATKCPTAFGRSARP
jgi:hypothetical protein